MPFIPSPSPSPRPAAHLDHVIVGVEHLGHLVLADESVVEDVVVPRPPVGGSVGDVAALVHVDHVLGLGTVDHHLVVPHEVVGGAQRHPDTVCAHARTHTRKE